MPACHVSQAQMAPILEDLFLQIKDWSRLAVD
jgi:nitrate reductase cytochrome c-type subunit